MGFNPSGETDKFKLSASRVRGECLEITAKNQQMCEESAPSEFESTCSRKYFKIHSC